MSKLDKIWKSNVIAMLLCLIIAIALFIFPLTHPADLLVMSHPGFVTMVHQMPYFGCVMLFIAWVFWFKAFDAAFHGARAAERAAEEDT